MLEMVDIVRWFVGCRARVVRWRRRVVYSFADFLGCLVVCLRWCWQVMEGLI